LPETGLIQFKPECEYSIENGPFLDFFHPLIDLDSKQIRKYMENNLVFDLDEIKDHFQKNWQIYVFSSLGIVFLVILIGLTRLIQTRVNRVRIIRRTRRTRRIPRRPQSIFQIQQPLIPAVRYFEGGVEIREV
jgi:hypothetical protein